MQNPAELERLLREFEILNGTRAGSDKAGRAVRMREAQAMLEFPRTPRSKKAAGATPTKAEFDLLVEDVHLIFRQMGAFADALRNRLE